VEAAEETLGCLAKSMEDSAALKAAGVEKLLAHTG
jgi:hypothetical protein